jgi:hypothetical protein
LNGQIERGGGSPQPTLGFERLQPELARDGAQRSAVDSYEVSKCTINMTETADTDGIVEQCCRAFRRAGIRDLQLGVAHGEPATLVTPVCLVGAAESPLDLPDDQAAGTIVALAGVGRYGLPGGADGVDVEFVSARPWTVAPGGPPSPAGGGSQPGNERDEDGIGGECVVVCGEQKSAEQAAGLFGVPEASDGIKDFRGRGERLELWCGLCPDASVLMGVGSGGAARPVHL